MTTPIDDNVLPFSGTITETPVNMTFVNPASEVIGRFWFDDSTRKWNFEGDMEESARKFIEFLNNVIYPKGA